MTKSPVVMMTVPLPTDVRRWIEKKAARNLSPMSSAIVIALRLQMQAEQQMQVAID